MYSYCNWVAQEKRPDLRGEIPQREGRVGGRNQKKDDKVCWENKTIDLDLSLAVFELTLFMANIKMQSSAGSGEDSMSHFGSEEYYMLFWWEEIPLVQMSSSLRKN